MRSAISQTRDRQAKNLLGILTVGSLGIQSFLAVLWLLNTVGLFQAAHKTPPPMVQLTDGTTIAMQPLDDGNRTTATVERFVRESMQALLSANSQIPSPDGKSTVQDPGVNVGKSSQRVTSIADLASYALTDQDSFRTYFMQKLAEHTPQEVFNNGAAQQTLRLRSIVVDRINTLNQWRVTVIGELVRTSEQDPIGTTEPYNKVISVRSVPYPDIKPYSSALEKQMAIVGQSGLEIYDIRTFVPSTPLQ